MSTWTPAKHDVVAFDAHNPDRTLTGIVDEVYTAAALVSVTGTDRVTMRVAIRDLRPAPRTPLTNEILADILADPAIGGHVCFVVPARADERGNSAIVHLADDGDADKVAELIDQRIRAAIPRGETIHTSFTPGSPHVIYIFDHKSGE